MKSTINSENERTLCVRFFVYLIFVKNILYYWFFSHKFALNTQN